MIELSTYGRLLDGLQYALSTNPGTQELMVSRRTLHNALTGFLDGKVNASELAEWASHVELRNDEIAYEPGFEKFIVGLMFRLSTPEINGSINKDLCREMITEIGQ